MSRQTFLIIILCILIVITAYLIWIYYIKPKAKQVEKEEIVEVSSMLVKSSFNTKILAEPSFKNLKLFGNLPFEINKIERGRENPFVSY